jgi:hypothetical protein
MNPNVVHETIDGETIILKLDTGAYYSLNDFGGEVWSLLGQGASPDEIVARCSSGFDGSPEQIEEAVRELVAELVRDDLLVAESAMDMSATHPRQPALEGVAQQVGRPLRQPVLRKYEDMQDLLMIDPFHDVPEEGWPEKKPAGTSAVSVSSRVPA